MSHSDWATRPAASIASAAAAPSVGRQSVTGSCSNFASCAPHISSILTTSDPFKASEHMPNFLVRSLVHEMSQPEQSVNALRWRRLHLSKAKLKASSRTSALLSGFAMVAMVEVNLSADQEKAVPTWLLVAFSVCTTLLVSVHMLALMISTCILPNVESATSIHGLAAPSESPHEKMGIYIEIAWAFSTVFGIFLFLVEIAILCWVKFWGIKNGNVESGHYAAVAASVVLVPVCAVFIAFAVHFYRNLANYKLGRTERDVQELESMIDHLRLPHEDDLNGQNNQNSTRPVLNI